MRNGAIERWENIDARARSRCDLDLLRGLLFIVLPTKALQPQPKTIMHLLTRVLTTTTLFTTPPTRLPPACMLLGADGLPMKKAGDASSTAAPSAEDKRPRSQWTPRRTRSKAAVVASPPSTCPRTSRTSTRPLTRSREGAEIRFLRDVRPSGRARVGRDGGGRAGRAGRVGQAHEIGGMTRVLGLFTAEDAGARSTAGTPEGYFQELVAAGPFEEANVGLIDPRSVGARDAVLNVLRQTQEAREKICIHCADGHKLTAIVLSDWLLTDYIGGGSGEYGGGEDLLAAEWKRLAGVGRFADLEELERWVAEGHL